jgi:undecaprenyl-diphosphatase
MDLLELLKYMILGAVQGITEVLPISSSGHVQIAKMLLNLESEEGLLFLILVNTGSLLVFLWIYRKVLLGLIKSFISFIFRHDRSLKTKTDFVFILKLIVATIPAGVAGFLFEDYINVLMGGSYGGVVAAIGLMVTGTVLLWVSQKRLTRGFTSMSYKDALVVGLSQVVALIPGVSRSGMTTSAGLANQAGIDSSLKFSFLLYIPISIGSLILEIIKVIKGGFFVPDSSYYLFYFSAFIMAVIFTAIGFKLVYPAFKTGKIRYFSFYCFGAGTFALILSIL